MNIYFFAREDLIDFLFKNSLITELPLEFLLLISTFNFLLFINIF